MKQEKFSRQREYIRSFLNGNTSHPTADEIYAAARRQFPNISLGTVYRNLALLEGTGEVKKLSFPGVPDHFDYNTDPHSHFICRKCRRVYDIMEEPRLVFEGQDRKTFPGETDGYELTFFGSCNECGNASK